MLKNAVDAQVAYPQSIIQKFGGDNQESYNLPS